MIKKETRSNHHANARKIHEQREQLRAEVQSSISGVRSEIEASKQAQQSCLSHVGEIQAQHNAVAEVLATMHARITKLEGVATFLYEHNRKLEEKLKATEHRRIKMEAVIRAHHMLPDEAQWSTRCGTVLQYEVPILNHAISKNSRDLISGLAPVMRSKYNVDLIDETLGLLRPEHLPIPQATRAGPGSTPHSPIAIDYPPPPPPPSYAVHVHAPDPRENANARALRLQAQAEAAEAARLQHKVVP